MPTKTKEKQSWSIPEEHHAELRDMAKAHTEGEIRARCAKNRMEKAIKEGDAELALKEREIGLEFQRQYKDANTTMWAKIHEAVPELDEAAKYDFDPDAMEITPDEDSPMTALSRMFGGRGED